MADFAVRIEKIGQVIPIEGADRIEAVTVGDFQSITMKGQFQPGDLVAYIPEQAVVPDWLLEEMGLVGKLSGSRKNRVKAVKMKNVLSQGLVFARDKVGMTGGASQHPYWTTPKDKSEGMDVTELLGIIKWEPELPAHFSGKLARPRGDFKLLNYDIENIKRWGDTFVEGEMVEMTEKIHGTLLQAAWFRETDQCVVSSKGLGARGLIIEDVEANWGNVYIETVSENLLFDSLDVIRFSLGLGGIKPEAIFIVGEVFGVQDLKYGTKRGFRVFDIYLGLPGQGYFLDPEDRDKFCNLADLQVVPVLYRGPYYKTTLKIFTNGAETVSGSALHIREGVVIKPMRERSDDSRGGLGRVVLKSVSEAYLLRKAKNGVEVTEFA